MAQQFIKEEGTFHSGIRIPINANFTELYSQVAPSTTQKIDYNGGTNATYIGIADPGTTTSSPHWQIKLITYDANSNPISITYADAGSSHLIWDNRTSYTYS